MCIISTRNITTAQIAKKILAREGIASTIVNIDPNLTKNGCSYGVSFNCYDSLKAKSILRAASVSFGEVGRR